MKINDKLFVIIFTIASLWIIFSYTNFNPLMAGIYSATLVLGAVIYAMDWKKEFKIKSHSNLLTSILYTAGALLIFYIVIAPLAGLSTNSMVQLMADYQPIFKDNSYLSVISFGTFIPIIETLVLFMILLDISLNFMKSKLTWKNPSLWVLIIIWSLFFMFLHATAKLGVASSGGLTALLITIPFAVISLVLIFLRKQAVEAIGFHIFPNTASTLIATGLVTSIPYALGIASILTLVWLYIMNLQNVQVGNI